MKILRLIILVFVLASFGVGVSYGSVKDWVRLQLTIKGVLLPVQGGAGSSSCYLLIDNANHNLLVDGLNHKLIISDK